MVLHKSTDSVCTQINDQFNKHLTACPIDPPQSLEGSRSSHESASSKHMGPILCLNNEAICSKSQ